MPPSGHVDDHRPETVLEKNPNSQLSGAQPLDPGNRNLGKGSNSTLEPGSKEILNLSPQAPQTEHPLNSMGSTTRNNSPPELNHQQISLAPTDSLTRSPQAEEQMAKSPNKPRESNSPADGDLDATKAPDRERDNNQQARLGGKDEKMGPPVYQGLIIKKLFAFCTNLYQEVLPAIRELVETPDRIKWEQCRGRFALWGDGYSVLEGGLDQLLLGTGSRYLRISAVIPLCSIAKTLCACLSGASLVSTTSQCSPNSNHPATKHNAELRTLLEVASHLMPEAGSVTEPNCDDANSPSAFDFSDAAENIEDSVDSLFDTVPFIDDLHLVTEPKYPTKERVSIPEFVDDPPSVKSQSYKRDILERFPVMGNELAGTLAEMNWKRHQRIWECVRNHENQGEAETVKSSLASPGLGNTVFNFRASLNPNQTNPFVSNASATSFEAINPTMGGDIRIPKMPIASSTGIIKCCLCFKNLSGVNTRPLWKKHVLGDLRPYSCLFDCCLERKTFFETKEAWVDHEFQYHRLQTEWRCSSGSCTEVCGQRDDFVRHILKDHLEWTVTASEIDNIVDRCKFEGPRPSISCPFCAEEIPENKDSIQTHIGPHMDEIALNALPQEIEIETETESDTPNEVEAGDRVSPLFQLTSPSATTNLCPQQPPSSSRGFLLPQHKPPVSFNRLPTPNPSPPLSMPYPTQVLTNSGEGQWNPRFSGNEDKGSRCNRKRRSGGRVHISHGKLYVCPYQLRPPPIYTFPGTPAVCEKGIKPGGLREHLRRHHLQPAQCSDCGRRGDEGQIKEHVKYGICVRRSAIAKVPSETLAIDAKLAQLPKAAWEDIWVLLFGPDVPVPPEPDRYIRIPKPREREKLVDATFAYFGHDLGEAFLHSTESQQISGNYPDLVEELGMPHSSYTQSRKNAVVDPEIELTGANTPPAEEQESTQTPFNPNTDLNREVAANKDLPQGSRSVVGDLPTIEDLTDGYPTHLQDRDIMGSFKF